MIKSMLSTTKLAEATEMPRETAKTRMESLNADAQLVWFGTTRPFVKGRKVLCRTEFHFNVLNHMGAHAL
jgi:hypothetical protein